MGPDPSWEPRWRQDSLLSLRDAAEHSAHHTVWNGEPTVVAPSLPGVKQTFPHHPAAMQSGPWSGQMCDVLGGPADILGVGKDRMVP